jgi:pimeloyl-ACP methyl ester carboxylesterase
MTWQTHDVAVAPARTMTVLECGRPSGLPVVFHLGTPFPPVEWPSLGEAADDLDLRILLPARPGYAGSTRLPGRSVRDIAPDTETVLDRFEIDRFVTIGWSGGGPHALACASQLDRCLGAISLAGVVPWDAPDIEWMAGMAEENVEEFSTVLEGEEVLRPYLAEQLAGMKDLGADEVAESLGGLAPPVDAASLTGELAEVMAAGLRRAAHAGLDGWVDDDLAFAAPWGFDPVSIEVPVVVWQGRHDTMVPFDHGRWLVDHLPTAVPRLHDDEGHISLLTTRLADILADAVGIAD